MTLSRLVSYFHLNYIRIELDHLSVRVSRMLNHDETILTALVYTYARPS